jgi:hypothetical protein
LDNVIGVASSGPSTGSGAAELVSGIRSENLVLAASAVIPVATASATASGIRVDFMGISDRGLSNQSERRRQQ